MTDYIDRKAVMNTLAELYAFYGKEVRLPHERACLMNDIDSPRMAIEKAEKMVLAISSDDVVSVVRCKDCGLWNEYDRAGRESLNNLRCSCANFSGEDGYTVYTAPNDFCSYGERKVYEEDI